MVQIAGGEADIHNGADAETLGMVTISSAEYDEKQRRIAKLAQQVVVLTEALCLSRYR